MIFLFIVWYLYISCCE